MKKILLIAPSTLPIPSKKGGAIETLMDYFIGENLINESFELKIVSFGQKNQIKKEGCNNYVYIKRNFISKINDYIYYKFGILIPYIIRKVNNILTLDNYDYVIVEGNKDYILPLKLRKNEKLLFHIHHDVFNRRTLQNEKILAKVDRVICVSQYIKKISIKKYEKFKSKFIVLNNCCSNDFFLYEHFDNSILRNRYNLKDDDFIVLYVGRLVKEKGVIELLNALEKCQYNIKLFVIGNSSFGSKKISEYGRTVLDIIDQNDNFFYLGQIPHNLIPNYILSSNLQIIPSIWEEPCGLVAIEGMALGIPMVCTRSGGIPEYLYENYPLIVDNNEYVSDNILDKINYAYENKGQLESISIELKKHGKKYTTKNYFNGFKNIIENTK